MLPPRGHLRDRRHPRWRGQAAPSAWARAGLCIGAVPELACRERSFFHGGCQRGGCDAWFATKTAAGLVRFNGTVRLF